MTPQLSIKRLMDLLPGVQFVAGNVFCWSPSKRQITYKAEALRDQVSAWSLIHEVGHALLDHQDYKTDFELLRLEVAAWERAKALATDLNATIDSDHIQDCLDTYRDWLHRRSTCPTCGTVSLQQDRHTYKCHNCLAYWHVSTQRFCRAYRKLETAH